MIDTFGYVSFGTYARGPIFGSGIAALFASFGLLSEVYGGKRVARLICDEPGGLEGVTHYIILGLPTSPIDVLADPDPAIGFSYDLAGLVPGDYTVMANACNDYVCSIASAPFTFTVLGTPSAPTGLGILIN